LAAGQDTANNHAETYWRDYSCGGGRGTGDFLSA